MVNGLAASRFNPRHWARQVLLLATLALSGCATHYVDSNTKEVPVADYKKPVNAKPVQLLFEFQTRGAINTRATDFLKAQVSDQVKTSGLFSAVDDKPVAGGALLSVTLNNVPLTDDLFTKGFVTGLTFGLAGSTVSDGYVCTVKYVDAGHADPIVKMARHAIHTTMGASGAPPNAIKADSVTAAINVMTRQIVSQVLNDLAQDPAFP